METAQIFINAKLDQRSTLAFVQLSEALGFIGGNADILHDICVSARRVGLRGKSLTSFSF